jgi:two-component system chemotaxis response regulator CheB
LKQKIRVLVIDDSLLFREMLAKGIERDPGIEVVGTAADPFMARDMILRHEPDVLTLDVEMPKMSGIEFLKRLMPQYPLPVVVVSSVSSNVFDALNAGAVDFVTKPNEARPGGVEGFINELIVKIKIASTAKVGRSKSSVLVKDAKNEALPGSACDIIAIGASTGGTEAIYEVIKAFPRDMPGIVVVQHMPPVFTGMYAERLNNSCRMEVREARNGDMIVPGRVLVAPGDFHMKVKRGNAGYYVECKKGERVNGHCPSVDVLFNSICELEGLSALGVILTGMGYDGARGLLNMKKKGAYTIGQDEQSSIVYGMPKVAYDIAAVVRQAPLEEIPGIILSVIRDKSV